MKYSILVASLAGTAFAAIGSVCTGGGSTGTCQKTSWCDDHNGSHNVDGACPYDPNNVKCCFFPTCKSGTGFCDITTSRVCHISEGHFVKGYCPGPGEYQCCVV